MFDETLSGVFIFFVFLQLITKVFYCWMNMFKSVIWLKGSHLEIVPRSIKEITCITKRKSQKCQNGELNQPKMCETKIQLQSKSLENWSYFALSVIIQASSKHQLLKITVRIPPGLPKILGMTRIDWQKHNSRPCSIMCGKMCAWFKFSSGLKNLLLRGLSIFYFTGIFQVPAVHWWTWRQGPWLLTCLQGAVWLQDYLISLLRDSKKQYKP